MLKFIVWLLILVVTSIGLASLTDLSGSLRDLLEQYFLALILLAALPLLMPGRN